VNHWDRNAWENGVVSIMKNERG